MLATLKYINNDGSEKVLVQDDEHPQAILSPFNKDGIVADLKAGISQLMLLRQAMELYLDPCTPLVVWQHLGEAEVYFNTALMALEKEDDTIYPAN